MSGPTPDAIAQLRRAAESGRDLNLWTHYVSALLQAGQKGRARKVAKTAPLAAEARKSLVVLAEKGIAPGSAPLQELAALVRAGKNTEARRLGFDLEKRYPDDAKLLNVLGVMALSAEDPLEGEAYLRRAMKIDPENVDVLSNLGLALVRQGRGAAAIEILEPIALTSDALMASRVNLLSAYVRSDAYERALALSVEILKVAPNDVETRALRASAQLALGQAAASLETLAPLRTMNAFDLHDLVADALERSEGRNAALHYVETVKDDLSFEARKRLAKLLGEWGDLEAARAMARVLANEKPSDPTGVRFIGLYGRWEADDPLIETMRSGLADSSFTPTKRGSFGLALAKALMDAGNHDKAFQALVDGNAQLRKSIVYDVSKDVARMQDIADAWSAGAIRNATGQNVPDIAPVFIVGLPRSGSTLIETILSRHPLVKPLGESPKAHVAAMAAGNNASVDEIQTLRDASAAFLAPSKSNGAVTDKLLANFLCLGALAAAYPNARFIEARRDLRATALSIFQTELGPSGHPYSMDLSELAQYCAAQARLMAHWHAVLGDRIYAAHYERLVSDPVSEVPKLVSAAGLPWSDACLGNESPTRRISTFSVAQARAPITTASVARWTRYEKGLKPLIDILEREGLIHD